MESRIDVPELYTRLGMLEGKLDTVSSKIDDQNSLREEQLSRTLAAVNNLRVKVDDQEQRIASIEKFRFALTAVGTFVGAVLGYFMPYIRSIFPA